MTYDERENKAMDEISKKVQELSEKRQNSKPGFDMWTGEYFWYDPESLLTMVKDLNIDLKCHMHVHPELGDVLVCWFSPREPF